MIWTRRTYVFPYIQRIFIKHLSCFELWGYSGKLQIEVELSGGSWISEVESELYQDIEEKNQETKTRIRKC